MPEQPVLSSEQRSETQKPQNQGPNWRMVLRNLAPNLLINAVCPFIIYTLLKNYTHISEFMALVATGIPSLLDSIIGIIRNRRIDFIAGVVLLGIAVSLGITFLGGSPKVLLVRESFFTFAFGLAFLISLLFPKPLAFYTGRTFVAGRDQARIEWYSSLWQYASFRRAMRMQSIIWGFGLLLEAVVRTYLVFILPIPQFLVLSPIILYGIFALTFVAAGLYMRISRKSMRKDLRPETAGSTVPTSSSAEAQA